MDEVVITICFVSLLNILLQVYVFWYVSKMFNSVSKKISLFTKNHQRLLDLLKPSPLPSRSMRI